MMEGFVYASVNIGSTMHRLPPVGLKQTVRSRSGAQALLRMLSPSVIKAEAEANAEADRIIVAAPYYDLSFPASLKQYFEQINCVGITFKYAPEGYPIPLCNAKQLIYVMSAGGEFVPEEFGFGYVKSLAENFYGIKDVRLVKAVGLDIDGADVDKIMEDTMKQIDNCFAQ